MKNKREYFKRFDIKKTIPFKLLIGFLILLFFLIIVWIFVYEPKESEEGFGLPTLWFGEDSGTNINLEILDYQISEDNNSILINIKWIFGDGPLDGILVEFNKPEENCNYIIESDLIENVGENKTYTILQPESNCINNFETISNIGDLNVLPGVNISITSLKEFDSQILSKGENLTNMSLTDYFICNFIEDLRFEITVDTKNITVINEENLISFYPDYGWFGTSKIDVKAICNAEQITKSFEITVSSGLAQVESLPKVKLYYNENLTDLFDFDDYFECEIEEKEYIINNLNLGGENIIYFYQTPENILGSYSNSNISYEGLISILAICGEEEITSNFSLNYFNYTRPPANHPAEFIRSKCDDLVWYENTSYQLDMTECWEDKDNDILHNYTFKEKDNEHITINQENNTLRLVPEEGWIGVGYFYIYVNDSEEKSGERVDFQVIPFISVDSSEELKEINETEIEQENLTESEISILKKEEIQTIETAKKINYNFGQIIFYSIVVVLLIIILLVIWIFIIEKKKENIRSKAGFGISNYEKP